MPPELVLNLRPSARTSKPGLELKDRGDSCPDETASLSVMSGILTSTNAGTLTRGVAPRACLGANEVGN